MPYSGVPKSKWKDMEKCVKKVLKENPSWDKSRAIAVCHKSIMGKEAKMEKFRKFYPFVKVDKDKREVYGYASTERIDSDGEVVTKEAMAKALPDYMNLPGGGNLRVMHKAVAAGKVKHAKMDDKGAFIIAKVVDDDEWRKVLEKVYTGFSIGGKALLRKAKKILKLRLSEISLVDRPGNPDAMFTIAKLDKEVDIERNVLEGLKEIRFDNLKAEKIRKEVISQMEDVEKAKKKKEEKKDEVDEKKEEKKKKDNEPKVEVDEAKQIAELAEAIEKLNTKLDGVVERLEPADDEDDEDDEDEVKEEASEKLTKLDDSIDKLNKRIDELEKTAMPVKAKASYAVNKDESEDEPSGRLKEISERLVELKKIAKVDMERYQSERLADEAFTLIEEKEKLEKGGK